MGIILFGFVIRCVAFGNVLRSPLVGTRLLSLFGILSPIGILHPVNFLLRLPDYDKAVASAAVVAAVVAQPEVEMEETMKTGEVDGEGSLETWEAEGDTEMESNEVPWEERDAVDQVLSGDFYDRHTKVYEPVGLARQGAIEDNTCPSHSATIHQKPRVGVLLMEVTGIVC